MAFKRGSYFGEARQARGQGRCGECGRRIERGEWYAYHSGRSEDSSSKRRQWNLSVCLRCERVRAALEAEAPGLVPYGDVRACLRERNALRLIERRRPLAAEACTG